MVTIETTSEIFKFKPENPNKKVIYQFNSNISHEDKLNIKKFFKRK